MSTHVSARVWKRSRSKGSARLVLLYLADNADDQGYCWPKVATIAEAANISERQARAALATLEADGELAFIAGQGRGHVSVYAVLAGLSSAEVDELVAGLEGKAEEIALALQARRARKVQSSQVLSPQKVQSSQVSGAEKVQSSHPSSAEKVQFAHRKGANRVGALPSGMPNDALIRHEIRHDQEESHESTSTTTTSAGATQQPQGGGGGAALLAQEGFGKKAIEAFGHLPAEILAADMRRRREQLGQGNGAIVNAWKVSPPGRVAPPAPTEAPLAPVDPREIHAAEGLSPAERADWLARFAAADDKSALLADFRRWYVERATRQRGPRSPADEQRRAVWAQATAALQRQVDRLAFDAWVRPAELVALDGGQATIAARSPAHAGALTGDLAVPLRRALADALARPVAVTVVLTPP